MKISIIGSGTGYPSKERRSPGSLIRVDNKNILIDCGAGTVRNLLDLNLTCNDLDCIFISHLHPDHTSDLIQFLFVSKIFLKRKDSVTILAPQGFLLFYNNLLKLYGKAVDPEAYRLNIKELKEDVVKIDNLSISTKPLLHTDSSVGFRIQYDDKVLAYSGDTDYCENLIELTACADVAILECSYPDDEKVSGHLAPKDIAQVGLKSQCKKIVLNHLYPSCKAAEILSQVKKSWGGEVVVSEDFLEIEV